MAKRLTAEQQKTCDQRWEVFKAAQVGAFDFMAFIKFFRDLLNQLFPPTVAAKSHDEEGHCCHRACAEAILCHLGCAADHAYMILDSCEE